MGTVDLQCTTLLHMSKVLCVLLMVFALVALAPSAYADDNKDGCTVVPGGPSPNGGTCAPHEPVVIIVDVWNGPPIVIVVSPGDTQSKQVPTKMSR